ncbi:MAG: 16S rRNA (adenine(1518)-N(6)/adenine(1519)-N(6))-dimethyltransferase RsmA [Alphaproteobacteria bacterium]|jgi:16S rRNA (adenine1518-N6/adenine1519-N6)-dimethyltransferase|nr:16S rRNA (adenine(1518)-N(6)/adenine(1519)-N(6))-dimethyltransferase RsmA [Alphaproteobacteria bacterium]
MRLEDLPPLKEVIKKYQLSAKKSLGQNFLLDLNLTRKIARLGQIEEGTTIIEIGCGPAGLTRAILEVYPNNPVVVIEKDERCVHALQDLVLPVVGDRLKIIQGDAMEIDYNEIAPGKKAIIANLPYNIATPLLIGWLKQIDKFDSLTLMFQKEVANRIVASVGDKAYGRLAVISNWLCNTKIVVNLPPQAFTPPPKVSSAVVHFKPKADREDVRFSVLENVVKQAFNQRRKMLRQSCKSFLPILEKLGIDVTKRAENLSLDEFLNISKEV